MLRLLLPFNEHKLLFLLFYAFFTLNRVSHLLETMSIIA
jgi:hypothetical protein